MTKNWSRVNLEVRVNYAEDVDRVIAVTNTVCEEFARYPKFLDKLLEAPSVLGLDSLGDFSNSVQVLVKTKPKEQWGIARELRRRIKKRFDLERYKNAEARGPAGGNFRIGRRCDTGGRRKPEESE